MFRSVVALVAAASAAPASASAFGHLEKITPEIAAERLSHCGLGAVTIRDDRENDAWVLTPASAATATNQQLLCVIRAANFYDVKLPEPLQARFDTIREARMAALLRDKARAWLSARGLVAKIPPYKGGSTDDAAFTRKIERLCGPRASGAFQSSFGFHALSPEWTRRHPRFDKAQQDVFACLLNSMTFASFELHFIGNAAVEPGS